MDLNQWTTIGGGLVVIVGGLYAAWRRWLRPLLLDAVELGAAARVTLLGHPEVRDPGNPSKVLEPARPGALDRLGNLEEAVTTLTANEERFAEHERLLHSHADTLHSHAELLQKHSELLAQAAVPGVERTVEVKSTTVRRTESDGNDGT